MLAQLICPGHPQSRLELEPGAQIDKDGAIWRGRLCCTAPKASYTVDQGIVDFIGSWDLPTSPAQLVNYLAPTAWVYERAWRPHALTLLSGEPFGYDRELPLISQLMALEQGGLYLDVACSNGLYARALSRALSAVPGQSHVVGVDYSLPMLRQAQVFAQREKLSISYIRAKAQGLPFRDGSIDGVMMGGSLNEIGDVDACLREIRRVLTRSGRCFIMNLIQVEHPVGRAFQAFLGVGGVAFWTLEELNRRFRYNGLILKAQWRYGAVVFTLLVPAPVLAPANPVEVMP
ncbi:MAG: class I SAM-dependent methyltransferase [Chloroflexales bacterium]|nr:class I SAM-dependent methyltransferase [Chloroflexales bacterium]